MRRTEQCELSASLAQPVPRNGQLVVRYEDQAIEIPQVLRVIVSSEFGCGFDHEALSPELGTEPHCIVVSHPALISERLSFSYLRGYIPLVVLSRAIALAVGLTALQCDRTIRARLQTTTQKRQRAPCSLPDLTALSPDWRPEPLPF